MATPTRPFTAMATPSQRPHNPEHDALMAAHRAHMERETTAARRVIVDDAAVDRSVDCERRARPDRRREA